MLRHGEIYFASVAELNDANECRPRFILNGSEELWMRLAQLILGKVCFSSDYYKRTSQEEIGQLLGLSVSVGRLLKKQVRNRDVGIENLGKLFVDALKPLLEQKFSALQSRLILELSNNFIDTKLLGIIAEPKYIASFSMNATNPTMWGHYAKAEKGFVIVYATEDGTINVQSPINILYGSSPSDNFDGVTEIGCYQEAHIELESVKYGRRPPKVNAFHRLIPKFFYTEREDYYDVPLLLGGDAGEKEENQIGLVKYSDWRYEQEIRAFFPNSEELGFPDVRLLRVSINNIKGLIFGPSMADDDKSRAILSCHLMRKSLVHPHFGKGELSPEFVFFQAKQVLDRFDFEIQPVGILEDHNFEHRLPLKLVQHLDDITVERLQGMSERIKSKNSVR